MASHDKFRTHQGRHQTDQGRHSCTICGRNFGTKASLKSHSQREHEGVFPYYCQYCGKGFHVKGNLKGHLVKHTSVREFKCTLCNKEFGYKSSHDRHMREVHELTNQLIWTIWYHDELAWCLITELHHYIMYRTLDILFKIQSNVNGLVCCMYIHIFYLMLIGLQY